MNFKNKPQITCLQAVFAALLFCLVFGCTKTGNKIEPSKSTIAEDSIKNWISAGRNTKNSIQIRQKSLVKAYTKANSQKTDSAKLKYLSKIQWSFLNLKDSTWFRKTNKETNLLAKKLGDTLRLGGSHWDLGVFLNRYTIQDSAYYNLSKAQKLYRQLGENKEVGILFYAMAKIQSQSKDYTGSEINLINAIEIFKPIENQKWLFNSYNLLGNVLKDLNSYERSLQYLNAASAHIQHDDDSTILANNFGVTYMAMGNFEKAIGYFKKVLHTDSLRTKFPDSYARTLNNMAVSQYKLKDHDGIEDMFLESLKIRDSLDDQLALAGGYFSLAEYYTLKKDTLKAIVSANKSKVAAEKSSNNLRLLESLELLTKIDLQNASIHSSKYFALSDSLQQQERTIREKFARIRFETDEFIAENVALAKEKQLWTGIAASVILLGFASFIIFIQRMKNKNLRFKQAQQVSNQEIFNLMLAQSEKVEEGKKKEQKRVSEELHDGVLGKMLGARMMLLGLNKKTDNTAIGERAKAISVLQGVEGEIRSISHELSHAAYQKIHNFILSIKELIETIEVSSKININFDFTDELDWDALSGEIKINLYRMVQESLQNSVKHAACENIDMTFYANESILIVRIEDDGKGFIQKRGKTKKGIGMRNLASRAKKINSKWIVKSEIGKGTLTTFNIPLVSNETENIVPANQFSS